MPDPADRRYNGGTRESVGPGRTRLINETGDNRTVGVRREPARPTLADLLMLVAGFALSFSLPRTFHLTDRFTVGNVSMPGWIAYLFVTEEAAMRGGVILLPVILARRFRYGGLPGPADWLALVAGLPLLHQLIQRADWIKGFARWYLVDVRPALGYPAPPLLHEAHPNRGIAFGDAWYYGYDGFPVGFTPGDENRIWGAFAVLLLLVISAALGLGWRRMPDWAKTALLWLAVFTWLTGVDYLRSSGLTRAAEAAAARTGLPLGVLIGVVFGLGRLPDGLLIGVPVIAVLFDVRRRRCKTWAWTAWVGAASALLFLSISVGVSWYIDLVNRDDPAALTQLCVQTLQPVAVGVVSWAVVKRVRGAGAGPVGP